MFMLDNKNLIQRLEFISRLCGIFVMLIGGIVIIGWLFDLPTVRSILPHFVAMKFNTALCFFLSGLSIYLLTPQEKVTKQKRSFTRICVIIVSLIGLLSLSQYIFNYNLGIDQLFMKEAPGAVRTSHLGRMAPNTAFNFFIIGVAILILEKRIFGNFYPAQMLGLLEGVIALFPFIGYIYGVAILYKVTFITEMAIHTAVAFMLIMLGVIFSRPKQGFMRIFTSESAGGILLRWLLPFVIVSLIVFGWLELQGELKQIYPIEVGTALLMTVCAIIFAIVIFFVAKKLDTMEQKRRAVEKTLEMTRVAIDRAGTGVALVNKDARYIMVNSAECRVLGYSEAELLKMTVADIDPSYTKGFWPIHWRELKEAKFLRFETRHKRKDGSTFPVEISANFIEFEGQEYNFAFVQDITERKRIEDMLRKTSEFKEHLLKTIPFGMDIVDEEANILYVNEAFKKMVGFDPTGRKCFEVYKDDRKQCEYCPLKKKIELGEVKYLETPGVLGGKIFRIAHIGMFYEDKKAVLEIFEDITTQKEAQQKLMETVAAKSEFISMVSHELRTPLTAIKEGIAIVAEESAGCLNPEQKNFLDIVQRNVQRLARFIGKVLDYQKLDSGRMEFDMKPNDINRIVREVYEDMLNLAREKNLNFL